MKWLRFKKHATFAGLLSLMFLGGCATPKVMPYGEAAYAPAPHSTIYLMTATIKNAYKPSYQPNLLVLNIEKKDAKDSDDRLNFKMDDVGRLDKDLTEKGGNYLIRMELEKGEFVVRGLTSLCKSFPVVGVTFAPLHSDLTVPGEGIVYLGHVEAVIRERKEEEFKAGPSIPLIDQAVCGFSGGTYDIVISDQFEKDVAVFKEKFPQLRSATVQKAILPPFDRAKAQQWWQSH